jgi:hypothetical protein
MADGGPKADSLRSRAGAIWPSLPDRDRHLLLWLLGADIVTASLATTLVYGHLRTAHNVALPASRSWASSEDSGPREGSDRAAPRLCADPASAAGTWTGSRGQLVGRFPRATCLHPRPSTSWRRTTCRPRSSRRAIHCSVRASSRGPRNGAVLSFSTASSGPTHSQVARPWSPRHLSGPPHRPSPEVGVRNLATRARRGHLWTSGAVDQGGQVTDRSP